MSGKKTLKTRLKSAVCGIFLVLIGIFAGGTSAMLTPMAYAVEGEQTTETTETTETEQNAENTENTENTENAETEAASDTTDNCQESLGAIGWLVCPTTGKLSEAVDWLYDKLEGILQINPVEAQDGQPIYEIWKYCLSLANIVFVIFVLIVIYSQITGLGISNYGIKKSLPKLIVAAVLVNLSFLICSIAVDVSNMLGVGIRGVFQSVEDSVTVAAGAQMHLAFGDVLAALVGGGGLAVAGTVIAFETGAIWMLIPVVLGAIVSVVAGLVTIAMRQAVVVLLIMIAPLAIVATILPNTEQWFRKWKSIFMQMLVFYPMFSLLIGASSLAGFALIMSAKDGFGLLLGAAVQVFPLFFSLKLMQMSGSVLGRANAWMHGLAARPLGAAQSRMDLQRQLAKQKHLASNRAYTPSLRLMQFMSNRRIAAEADLSQHQQTVKNRGLAYQANRHYRYNGAPTRRGERAYEEQAENMRYQRNIARDQNQMNKGMAYLATNNRQRRRLDRLDTANVNESDLLHAERARGEKIEYENAVGFHKRMEGAMEAHLDATNGFNVTVDENGNEIRTPRTDYKFHFNPNEIERTAEMARYRALSQVMEGNAGDVQYAAAMAAQNYDTQLKVVGTKMQKYFSYTEPTKDVMYKLNELTMAADAPENIDMIIPGLQILNQRGDTDLVGDQLQEVIDHGITLGTHASQSLASFLMFDVKDNDPFLRRFGKYINLQTAKVFNANQRKNMIVTMDEYVRGEYPETDENGNVTMVPVSKSEETLLAGTSFDNIERTAMDNMERRMKHAYMDADGRLDIGAYLSKRGKVQKAIAPQFISANLKYLSGSEQIQSMVQFLTGYDKDGKARWEAGGDLAGDSEAAEAFFREQTLDYINAQTPTQLLGLRSDYQTGLQEHFLNQYLKDNDADWSEEAREEHRQLTAEYNEGLAEIQTRYGDLPAEEAQKRRKQDIAELKKRLGGKIAGAEFRQLLDQRGKLEQIYRTRRSGAANNAKDWVRQWLNLDDEIAINKKLNKANEQRRAEHRDRSESDQADEEPIIAGGFDQNDRAFFATQVQAIWDDWHSSNDVDVEEFYDETRQFVQDTLDGVGDTILRKYAEFHRDHPYGDAYELREYLIGLLQDPDNY